MRARHAVVRSTTIVPVSAHITDACRLAASVDSRVDKSMESRLSFIEAALNRNFEKKFKDEVLACALARVWVARTWLAASAAAVYVCNRLAPPWRSSHLGSKTPLQSASRHGGTRVPGSFHSRS